MLLLRRSVGITHVALPAALLAFALVVPASPGPMSLSAVTMTQEQMDERYAKFRTRINDLRGQGKSQKDIDDTIAREFQIIPLNGSGGNNLNGAPIDLAATAGSHVLFTTPSFGYDTLLRKYVMSASWEWKRSTQTPNPCSGATGPCWTKDRVSVGNMGGPDGMAIKISKPIFRYSAGLSTSNNCGTPAISTSNADTDTGYGVGFIEQDAITGVDLGKPCAGTAARYNWHRGTISETFLFQGSCAGIKMQIDSKMGHTWSSTSVNSIGISTNGISIGWSTTSNAWNAIPETPGYGYC